MPKLYTIAVAREDGTYYVPSENFQGTDSLETLSSWSANRKSQKQVIVRTDQVDQYGNVDITRL